MNVLNNNGDVTNNFRAAVSVQITLRGKRPSTDLLSIRSTPTFTQCRASQATSRLADLRNEPAPSVIDRVDDKTLRRAAERCSLPANKI
ncbi:hypothetical protein GQ600_18997 [Phytophthora cactorum]|nr:hypothetical protein GQ600_18997 [Phytophthora cactorum]